MNKGGLRENMILCLDIGNTQIFGGVYDKKQLKLRFRYETNPSSASDQLGVFFRNVLKENQIKPESITQIAISSVVASLDYAIHAACIKYFNCEPFILTAKAKIDISIKTLQPTELGADLIACAIAAVNAYSERDLIIADFGTATTFAIVTAKKEYLGTVILPGVRLSMLALGEHTAKLYPVEIVRPGSIVGKTTSESIQAGLYYGHIGIIREVIARVTKEAFAGKEPVVLGTGGFANLFREERIFTDINQDLVLEGLLAVVS